MLGSIGTKDGTILYYIKYGTILGCPVISGVIGCGQICCTCAPTCVAGVFGTISYKEVMNFFLINLFNLSSTRR
jgi:hypothetical protein